LQVFDESGGVIVDVTTNLVRIIGSITITTASGSLSIPEFSTGRGWYFAVDGTPDGTFIYSAVCSVTITTSGLSWSYTIAQVPQRPLRVFYGVY